MLSFKQYILVEAKIDDYKAQETHIPTDHDPEAKFKNSSDIIDHFHKHSPGGNVQHTRWMIDKYKKGEMKQEDAPDMKETLSNFDKYKPNLPKKRVEQYKSIADLKSAIHPFKEKDEGVQNINKQKIKEGSTIVHDSPSVTAYHVHTKEAAQELGKSPKGEKLGWCTSHPDPDKNMFDHYNNKSNKDFHILHMHKEEFPYRRIGGVTLDQFQDENNEKITGKRYKDFLDRNPELHKVHAVTNSVHHAMQMVNDPTTKSEELDKFVDHHDPGVRSAVADHPNASKEQLHKLAGDTNTITRQYVASNPNTSKETLDKLVDDKSDSVRMLVAKHPNSDPKDHLDKLIDKKQHFNVRAAVALSPNAEKRHFDQLVGDENDDVKQRVAEHTPHKEHLEHLATHPNFGISYIARKRLEKLQEE